MEKVVLSKEQTENFVRLLTEKPPQYWTIKQFLTYVNEKLKEPYIVSTLGEEVGVRKYTLRMFYYDMRQLGIGTPLSGLFCFSGNDLCRVFFYEKHDKFYVRYDRAEGLFGLIRRLLLDWDFHCFVKNDTFYFCDIFEHPTSVNPTGRPQITGYKLSK